MSANIPFEIQSEIIKRVLHVKSLIRFRSVSKQWKSLIDNSEFITGHSVNRTHRHHVLVRYHVGFEYKYVSIADDNSFPQRKSYPVVSPIDKSVRYALMLDCSHGLVCLYGYDAHWKPLIVLWNPSIRKSISIALPNESTTIGFGVCPKTSDPKIVMITRSYEIQPVNYWKVKVFALSSGSWRTISVNMHFPRSTEFRCYWVVIDGVIHWATHNFHTGYCDFIVSFNLISEELGKVDLPDSLARRKLFISKIKESLAVYEFNESDKICDVWMMMKNGFVKMSSVSYTSYDGCYLSGIIGVRKNGQLIWEHRCSRDGSLITTLEDYEPSTKHRSDIGIHVPYDYDIESFINFKVTSYTESLLLLNHSVSIV